MADEKIIQDQMELTKRQMEETRESLAAKLDTLESKVVQTVEGATQAVNTVKSTVENTVETVKDTVEGTVSGIRESVQDTVDSVKGVFDLKAHVCQHPWMMLGGSMAVGFLGGMLFPASEEHAPEAAMAKSSHSNGHGNGHGPKTAKRHERSAPPEHGWLHSLIEKVEPEIDLIKNMAIGTLVTMAEGWLAPSIPKVIQPQFREMMEDISQKLTSSPERTSASTGKKSEASRFSGSF